MFYEKEDEEDQDILAETVLDDFTIVLNWVEGDSQLLELKAKLLHHLGWLNFDFTPMKNLEESSKYYKESHELVIELKGMGYENT